MTNVLSSISGQFSKALILGTFMPTVLFVLLVRLLVGPLIPFNIALFNPLETLDPQWRALALLFIMIILTGLLYNLNRSIIRFYEGYPWQQSWFGKWRTRHYQAQLEAAAARKAGLDMLLSSLDENTHSDYDTLLSYWNRILHQLNEQLPKRKELILPTRLGNVMRSYEYYPFHQYGMDAIVFWPRLIAMIDEQCSAAIDDAKSSFDFMINCSALSALLALLLLGVELLFPTRLAQPIHWQLWLPWLLAISVFAGLAWLFYQGAIISAAARGEVIKGAFDLYRCKLLEQLGYERKLTTRIAERAIWSAITDQILFGDNNSDSIIDYAIPAASSTSAQYTPPDTSVSITRGVQATHTVGTITVVIQVTSTAPQKQPIDDMIISDTVPDGYDYEWDSAQIDGQKRVTVTGLNPYQFMVPTMLVNAGEQRDAADIRFMLTYRIQSRTALIATAPLTNDSIWNRLARLFSDGSQHS